MPDPIATAGRRGPSPATLLWTLLFGLLLGALGLGVFLHQPHRGMLEQIAAAVAPATRVDTSLPAVVSRIQKLSRLETVTYSMDKIVEGDRQSTVLPDFLVGDRLLLVVHGEVVAGVDLGGLKPSDIEISGRSVTVRLPQPQVFLTRIDSQKTRVFERSTGLFVTADPNLESETRARAEQQIRDEALRSGILDTARKNAAAALTTMLTGLGFEHIAVG
jgi:hypothetical protein